MKRWHYTNDVHDYILIKSSKFKLNTAYDNVFVLFRAIKDEELKNKVEVFLKVMFYERDHKTIKELTKNWKINDYTMLMNHIITNVLFIEGGKTSAKKYADIDIDSELIFASFYYDYNISLIEKKGKMTWKEFLILFENLSEASPFGRAVKLLQTPAKDLTTEGNKSRLKRMAELNSAGTDLNGQIDSLAGFLKKTAKKEKKDE
ncbi:MAG: hypothetical protein KAX49_07215 [Halanaerobiales bacterium]|nr:hypothetical protein [Halanaerobiales bacterium]